MYSFGCTTAIAVMAQRRHLAFSFPRPYRHVASNSKVRPWSATAATELDLNIDHPTTNSRNNRDTAFHPLGPPSFLVDLPVGREPFHLSSLDRNITRLSSSPDIFLVNDFTSIDEGEILMQSAALRGMKIAGTRQSGVNTIRKNSQLIWIDPYSFDDGDGDNYHREASSIAREAIAKSRLCFSHEVMTDLMENAEGIDYAFAEDMQVAKYDAQGRFDYHHDGYGRYLTVIAYLNGVGGTYFPFGCMTSSELDGIDFANENEVSVMAFKKRAGKCGLLIVGKEGADSYLNSTAVNPRMIVEIQAGDAIAFYNYSPDCEKDLRSLHCSLTVPEEKWISTCWFRSEALTGPFSSLKRARLLEEWVSKVFA